MQTAARGRLFAEEFDYREEAHSVLGRPGSDLLFQALRLSTIGAGEINGRVRDGIGFKLPANTTRPAKDRNQGSKVRHQSPTAIDDFSKQAGHFTTEQRQASDL